MHEYSWPFLVATGTYTVTSGTAEKAFSAFSTAVSDFGKPLRVWNGTTEIAPMYYEERNIPGNKGYYITPDNLSIGMVPAPTNSTDVITVDYLKIISDLSADSDEPIFVKDFHYIMLWGPLISYQLVNRENTDEFKAMYERMVSDMIAFYKVPSPTVIPIMMRGFRNIKRDSSSPLSIT